MPSLPRQEQERVCTPKRENVTRLLLQWIIHTPGWINNLSLELILLGFQKSEYFRGRREVAYTPPPHHHLNHYGRGHRDSPTPSHPEIPFFTVLAGDSWALPVIFFLTLIRNYNIPNCPRIFPCGRRKNFKLNDFSSSLRLAKTAL